MFPNSAVAGALVTAALVVLSPDSPAGASSERSYQRALSRFRQGAFDQSLRDAQMARARTRWFGSRDGGWGCKFRLLEAEILLAKAETSRARELLDSDADVCRTDIRIEVHRRVLLATLQLRRSPNPSGALNMLDEARRIAESAGSAAARAEVELLRGQVLARSSIDRAEDAFRSAQQFALAGHDTFQYAAAANNLGLVQQRRSRCDSALPYFNQALTVWRDLRADQLSAATANNLGLCYSELGNFDRALEYRQEALRLVKPGPRLAEVLGETGRLYLVKNQAADAVPYFRRALEAAKKFNTPADAARWASNLSTSFLELGDWNAAEATNNEALSFKPDPGSVPSLELNRAAIAAGKGCWEEAREIYQKTLASTPGNAAIRWQAHAGLAKTWLALGDWARAAQSFENGIDVVETSRSELSAADHRITFLSRLIRFYRDYVDALMDRGLTVRAMEVADSSRARVLAEDHSPEGDFQRKVLGENGLRDLARRTGSVWLSYWIAPRRSFLWVVTEREIRSFVLPPETQITKAVEEYRYLVEHSVSDPLRAHTEAGTWLFRKLVDVARAAGLVGERVVIVPDGPLHLLNFETLPAPDATPRYWIEDVLVTIAPSFELWARASSARKNSDRSILIMGNANGSGPEYPPLQYAANEISVLRDRFPGPTTTVITGEQADPTAYFRSHPERYTMIHVAAHGEANRRSPLDSALILSPGEKGFKLYARDIMTVPLNADLVTISACRSSGARAYAGEGLIGVARAFLHAGARAVIAGLWDVSDYSTSLLMDQMYRRIAAGVPPAESLREAKISLLRSGYSKPYYWGPFQIYARHPVVL